MSEIIDNHVHVNKVTFDRLTRKLASLEEQLRLADQIIEELREEQAFAPGHCKVCDAGLAYESARGKK